MRLRNLSRTMGEERVREHLSEGACMNRKEGGACMNRRREVGNEFKG
jgi:hypothetical protein